MPAVLGDFTDVPADRYDGLRPVISWAVTGMPRWTGWPWRCLREAKSRGERALSKGARETPEAIPPSGPRRGDLNGA